jgi:hypothetical protein
VSLDVFADNGMLHLLTGESAGGEVALLYQYSEDGGGVWSNPVRVDRDMPAPHHLHRSSDAQIAASGNQLVAVWSTSGTGWGGGGPLVTAVSNDRGRSWRLGANPADDNRDDGHGFADLTAQDGRFHAAWLDNRDGVQGLRYANSDDGGESWSKNQSPKRATCECCWNNLTAANKQSIYLLFRDKEPRDMALITSHNSGASWSKIGVVGAFDWRVDACPHTGGALALPFPNQRELHALVWSGKAGETGLYFLTSNDDGANWTRGIRLGGQTAQRGDLAAPGSEVAAVWDESVENRAASFVARSHDGGQTWSEPLRLSPRSADASYPRVVSSRQHFVVFWTEAGPGEPARLRIVMMR